MLTQTTRYSIMRTQKDDTAKKILKIKGDDGKMTKEKFEVLKDKYRGLNKKRTAEQIGNLWCDVETEEDLTRVEILELMNILFAID